MKTTFIEPRLLEIFLEIIKIEGISEEEKHVADYIINFLKTLNLHPKVDNSKSKTNSNTGNVICELGNGGDFLLCCHMDTARSTKNIKPILREDKITSNGETVLGVDNRAGIALLLYVTEKILTENIPHKNFTLVFTTCEETSLEGSKNLKLKKKIKNGFIFDSYQKPGNYINKSFGAASFNIKIIGKAAHSGIEPEKGVNALKIVCNAISKIEIGMHNTGTTVNFGKIEGGSSTNVVPELITLEGEVRASTKNKVLQNIAIIQKRFERETNKLNGKLIFNWRWDFEPYYVSGKENLIHEVKRVISQAGLKPFASISKGGSDANSLNSLGIKAINLGIGAQNPHSNDEFILFEDFNKNIDIALNLVGK